MANAINKARKEQVVRRLEDEPCSIRLVRDPVPHEVDNNPRTPTCWEAAQLVPSWESYPDRYAKRIAYMKKLASAIDEAEALLEAMMENLDSEIDELELEWGIDDVPHDPEETDDYHTY